MYRADRNGNIGMKGFNNSKRFPPVGLGLMQEIISGLGVQCLTGRESLNFCSCTTWFLDLVDLGRIHKA